LLNARQRFGVAVLPEQLWGELVDITSDRNRSTVQCDIVSYQRFFELLAGYARKRKDVYLFERANRERNGIPLGGVFQITFECRDGCWPGDLDFRGTANLRSATVPEPASVGLVLIGLGGIARRKWLQRTNS